MSIHSDSLHAVPYLWWTWQTSSSSQYHI